MDVADELLMASVPYRRRSHAPVFGRNNSNETTEVETVVQVYAAAAMERLAQKMLEQQKSGIGQIEGAAAPVAKRSAISSVSSVGSKKKRPQSASVKALKMLQKGSNQRPMSSVGARATSEAYSNVSYLGPCPVAVLQEYFELVAQGKHVIDSYFAFITASDWNRKCFANHVDDSLSNMSKDREVSIDEFLGLLRLCCEDFPIDFVCVTWSLLASDHEQESALKLGEILEMTLNFLVYEDFVVYLVTHADKFTGLEPEEELDAYNKLIDRELLRSFLWTDVRLHFVKQQRPNLGILFAALDSIEEPILFGLFLRKVLQI